MESKRKRRWFQFSPTGDREPSLKLPRRRWLTFSLRTLLLFFLACSIGLAWWRQPYQVEVTVARSGPDNREFEVSANYCFCGNTPSPFVREVRTVRRTLPGETVLDGPTVAFDEAGRTIREENWSYGELEGAYTHWTQRSSTGRYLRPQSGPIYTNGRPLSAAANDGSVTIKGQYSHGVPIGKWVCLRYDGAILAEQQLDQGKLIGTAAYYNGEGAKSHEEEFRDGKLIRTVSYDTPGGEPGMIVIEDREAGRAVKITHWTADQRTKLREYDVRAGTETDWYLDGTVRCRGHWQARMPAGVWEFRNQADHTLRALRLDGGRLVSVDGQPIGDFPAPSGAGASADSKIKDRLLEPLQSGRFINAKLSDVVDYLQIEHNIPIHIDRRALAAKGIGDSTTLAADVRPLPLGVALYLMLKECGLVYTCRHEQVWITTAEQSQRLNDGNRVPVIDASANPKTAKALEQYADFDYVETPIKDVAKSLTILTGVEVGLEPGIAELPESDNRYSAMIEIRGISLRAALETLFDDLDLACSFENDILTIRVPMKN